ncbi:hypothetical protein C5167_001686 [Papaver somniferum]|uniref:Uncharacterized protein n=1 Tax=Papaver somniferum TaxID=3469 RepID=A0A4Y7KZB8_PAPSO|nr:hypothetical protein C5167_001686 [Papaver somniferum]
MALRATGRLLSQRDLNRSFRNFSAKAVSSENVQKKLLDERRKKIILAEMKALTASAENNIAYWEPLAVKKKYVSKSSHRYVFVCHMYGG